MLEKLATFYAPLLLGVIYGRLKPPSYESLTYLSKLVLYLLLPFLLFRSTYLKASMGLGWEALGLPLLGGLTVVATGMAAFAVFGGKVEYVMTSMYANAGYLPLSLALPLWGDLGVASVGFYILGNNTTANVLIPLIASEKLREGLRRITYFAPLYGIFLGLLWGVSGTAMPGFLLEASSYLGEAAPTMALIILGMEFSRKLEFSLEGAKVYVTRTVVALALFFLFSNFGLIDTGLDLSVALLESIMPSAVTNVVLAHEFSLDSQKVSQIVVTSTLIASFVSVPLFLLFYA